MPRIPAAASGDSFTQGFFASSSRRASSVAPNGGSTCARAQGTAASRIAPRSAALATLARADESIQVLHADAWRRGLGRGRLVARVDLEPHAVELQRGVLPAQQREVALALVAHVHAP